MASGKIYTRHDWPLGVGASRRKRRFAADEYHLDADVVVVGSGAGGAVVAAELAEGGLDVAVMEEGGYHPSSEFNANAASMVRKLYRDGGLTVALGRPPVIYAEGRCVGGSTVLNGGMSWRTPERILRSWNDDHHLADSLPHLMEPYFDRVEGFISAKLQAPDTASHDNELLRRGAEKVGWRYVENIRNQLHCAGTNNCAFGCPTDAKRSSLVSYIPRAVHFGARIYADAKVDRVLIERGRAVGVQGRVVNFDGGGGYRFVVRARWVVVAAGAVHTPALLLRSGVRTPSKNVGRNLTLHPNVKVVGVFDEKVDGHKGVQQSYQVRQFEEQGIGVMAAVNLPPAILAMSFPMWGDQLRQALQQYNHMVTAGVLVEDSVTGRVRLAPGGRPVVSYQLTDPDIHRFQRGMALLSELLFEAGAKQVYLPIEGMDPITSLAQARAVPDLTIKPNALEVATVHVMGTAAMGGDPSRHVCDSYGGVRTVSGLVVADASVFPSPIGVNPMETIMALATRNAEQILRIDRSRRAS
jgi:choline dehydrogenase-like flavoprotein